MKRALAAVLVSALAALSSGCLWSHGQLDVLGTGTAFDESQLRFSRLVRWGHWEMASAMVADDARDHFIEVMSNLGDVKFTDWEVMLLDVAKGFDTARVEIRLEGYRESNLRHAEAVMVQQWERVPSIESRWVVRPDVDAIARAFAAN